MKKPDNIKLPNLSTGRKVIFSLLLLGSAIGFGLTWLKVISVVYWSGLESSAESYLGIALGVLFAEDSDSFYRLFALHGASIALLLATTSVLFRDCALRRRTKLLIRSAALVLAAVDLTAWFYAPHCSSSNLYVGVIGLLSSIPLLALAIVPLFQMWVFRRWRKAPAEPARVVIVGGGFAGLYAAMGLHRMLGYHPKLEITLIDRKNYFLFPPLLPSAAAGTIETRQVSYPFRRIFETTNIIFRKVEVTKIDPGARTVDGLIETEAENSSATAEMRSIRIPYDYLVIAPGSLTQTFNTPGVAEHAFFMRELNDAVALRNQVIECFERAAVIADRDLQRELLRFVIVGAGPTGIETATEIDDLIQHILLKRYPEIDPGLCEVVIVQSGDQILPGWHPSIVATAATQLKRMGVTAMLGGRVSAVNHNSVKIGSDRSIATRTVIWSAGVRPSDLLGQCGLTLHSSGRAPVEKDLRASGSDRIFVLGDAAYLIDEKSGRALPPLGQVAFQQGAHTAKNIARLLRGMSTKPFRYFDFGGLVSVGEHFAAVNLLGVRISGFPGWLIWRSLYLAKLVGTSNKIRVLVDWSLDLLIERSISQIRDSRGREEVASAGATAARAGSA